MPEAEEWTTADAQATNSFFSSTAGQKLAMRFRNVAVQAAMKASQSPAGDHGLGIAAGISMTAAMVDAHCAVQAEEPEENKVVNL